MADDNDIDISEETIETRNDDNVYDIGNTSVHLNMSIDSNMDTSISQEAEDENQPEPINNINVIDYGVIDVRNTEGGIIGGNTSLEGFSMVDLTIVKTESLADDQIPSSSYYMEEPSSIYENPDSTTGVDYTPRKVDSPANVSSTQEEDSWHGNRLVLGKRKLNDTPAIYPESKLIHNLGDSFEHVASAAVLVYNMQVHLDRSKTFCAPCGTLFPSRAVAKLHSLKEHNKQCEECFLIFNTDVDLINHMTWHRKKDILKCTACQKTFNCNEDLIQHVYNFHFNIDKFSCKECNAKFTKESNLRQHELSCKNNIVLNKPLIVGKSTTKPKKIPVNAGSSSFLTKYVCKICKEIVYDKYQRKRHRRKHPEAKKYTSIYNTITQPIQTVKKSLKTKKSQLSTKTIEKDCLIPNNVLFFCPKCDCAFPKWKTAERHLDICKGFTANKMECKKCKVFVADPFITHVKQHSLGSDFQFIQLNSKNISEVLLFECPLCFVCFDDTIIFHHFNKCTLKRVLITKYYCDICKVNLPINYMTFHNMAHDKDDRFIIIKHGIINEAKLPARKLAKTARKATNIISNEYDSKLLQDMKEDNDDRIKLIRCSYCGLHQYVNNIRRALNPIHTAGKCRSSKYLFRSQNCCKYCALHFSQKCMPYHKNMHSKQELTLSNFVIYDSKSGKKIAPVSPETVVCNNCGVHFYVRKNRHLHKCEDNDVVPCNYCAKTFTSIEIDMHINFHLYSQKHDSISFNSIEAHVQDKDENITKSLKKLVKCPYCLIHVSSRLARHMKACKRSNQYNSQYCQICKIQIHNIGYNRHMFYRHNLRVNKLSKGQKYIKIDTNTNFEKDTSEGKVAEEILPTENEMHRVYKCKTCHIAYLSVAERNIHASKKCKIYDYESCISCGLIFENHKKHVAVHKNYPSFLKDNIRIVEFNKESLTKYIVRQCKYCNICLTNSSFERHRIYCKGKQTSILMKCNKCNLNINRKIVDKHLKYHKLNKDFTPSNIRVIICGDDDPKTDDGYPELKSSILKRKLDDNQDDIKKVGTNKKRKIESSSIIKNEDYDSQDDFTDYNTNPKPSTSKRRSIIKSSSIIKNEDYDSQDDYTDYNTNPKPSTSKRRSVAVEDPFKPDTKYLKIIYDKVITITTKKYVVFQCEDCLACFLTKSCEDHPKYCTKVKKDKPCNECGFIFKSNNHGHRPDRVRENITIIPVSMAKCTIYRCVRCQLCCIVAKSFHATTCILKEDKNYYKCDKCSLRFPLRSFQRHSIDCGHTDTIYVNDFDPLEGNKINNDIDTININNDIDTTKSIESLNVSYASEVDQSDPNESKLNNTPDKSLFSSHSKIKDKVLYYRCKFCKQTLSKPKSVKKHECNLNELGMPISSVRCDICKLIFVRPFMVYHNYSHTTYPEKYAIENVKIIDFDPVTEQGNEQEIKSMKDKLKEVLAEDHDSADDFEDANNTYEKNASKIDDSLNVSMENDDNTHKKTLYQCTNCKVCIVRKFYAEMHAHKLLKYKTCENKPILCKICNYSFIGKYIKRHLADHAKLDESYFNYNVIPFDTSLVQKPISIYVYKCVCSLHFVEFTVFCSHFGNCDKKTRVGKQCDNCKLNLNENQYLAHEKYHNSKTTYTFDVIELNDNEVPVVRRLYKCRVCLCHFTIKLAALKHIEHCDRNSNSKVCSCGIKFHENSIRIHQNQYLKRHHSKDEFEIEDVKRSDSAKNTIGDKSSTQTEASKYKIFICVSCKVSYLDYKECYEHVAMDIPSFKPVKCDLCSNVFVSSDLEQHKKDHDRFNLKRNDIKKVILRPPLADCIDVRNKELKSNLTGPKIDLYLCKKCDVNFINISTLHKHLLLHDLRQIKTCQYCSHRFSVITLHKHINLHHLDGINANPDCFNIIDIEKDTESETNKKHNNDKSSNNNSAFSISKSTPAICVSSFSTSNSTNSINETPSTSQSVTNDIRNTNVHDQDSNKISTTAINKEHSTNELVLYKCTDCYSHYLTEHSVSNHYNRRDRKVLNPIRCKYCGYNFAVKIYTHHLALHHPYKQKIDPEMFKIIDYPFNSDYNITLTSKASKKPSIGAQKKKKFNTKKLGKVKYFKCKECKVCFLNEREFKRHCNDHEKLPDYIFLECKICHLNFQISDLADHMKDHATLALEQTDICVEELCVVTGEVAIYLGDMKYIEDAEQDHDNSMNNVENDDIAFEESVIDNDTSIELSFNHLDDTADGTQSNNANNIQNLKNQDIKEITEVSLGDDIKNSNNEETCMETSDINETSEDLSVVVKDNIDDSAMTIDSTDLTNTGSIETDDPKDTSDNCKRIDDDVNSYKVNDIKKSDVSDSHENVAINDSQFINDTKRSDYDSKLLAVEIGNTEVVNSNQTTLNDVSKSTVNSNSSLEQSNNISNDLIVSAAENTHISKLIAIEENTDDTNNIIKHNSDEADMATFTSEIHSKEVIQNKTYTNNSDEKEIVDINVPRKDTSEISIVINDRLNEVIDNVAIDSIKKENSQTTEEITSIETNSNDTQNSHEINPDNSVENKTEVGTISTTDPIMNQAENTKKNLPDVKFTTTSEPSALNSTNTKASSTENVCLLREKILFEDN